jgi:hypothetical protein
MIFFFVVYCENYALILEKFFKRLKLVLKEKF